MIFKFVILQVFKILKLYFIFRSILQNAIDLLFDPIDTNKNGFIEFDEFVCWYEKYNMKNEKAKVNFSIVNYKFGLSIFLFD